MLKRKIERRLQITPQGFDFMEREALLRRFAWADIAEIMAWKRDELTVDTILLGFRKEEDETFCYISEDTAGFKALTDAMGKALPDLNPDWYTSVVFPPFAPSVTTVYRRRVKET